MRKNISLCFVFAVLVGACMNLEEDTNSLQRSLCDAPRVGKRFVCHYAANGKYVLAAVAENSSHAPGVVHEGKERPDLEPGVGEMSCSCGACENDAECGVGLVCEAGLR